MHFTLMLWTRKARSLEEMKYYIVFMGRRPGALYRAVKSRKEAIRLFNAYICPIQSSNQESAINAYHPVPPPNRITNVTLVIFAIGPRELTGAVDLISHYKLLEHHDFFCRRSLPQSISNTHYLHNVVGDTEIRKGDGMELDQLFQNAPYLRETTAYIRPFDLDALGQAFHLQETTLIEFPSADKEIPTTSGKSKESKDKLKKHKKHKDKDKEHKRHKHRHKDKSKDKDRERKKDKTGHHDSGGDHSKKHHDKKRKLESSEDITTIHKHKKSKVEEKFSPRLGISA